MKIRYAIALMITAGALCLGSAAVALATQTTPTTPTPVPTTQSATPSTPTPVASNSDDRNRDLYLADLRTQKVPVSVGGNTEILIAAGICDQLAAGTPRASLINDLNTTYAPIAGINGYYYSVAIVDAAARDYCAL